MAETRPPSTPVPLQPGRAPAPDATQVVAAPPGTGEDSLPLEVAQAPDSARFGRFVRVARIGSGGMGEVFKAWDPMLRRWIALKVLLPGAEEVLPWFRREGRLAAQLRHPGLIGIHEVGEESGRPFIAMEYVEGVTLDRLKGASRETLVSLIRDAAAAIGHAHENGIVHRDLKPENLMVESRPKTGAGGEPEWEHRIVVLDFGVARALGASLRLTAGIAAIGTPLYMSPEQARGEPPEPSSDVYSLGATLYEVLVGAPPIRGDGTMDTLRRVQEREPVPLRAIDPTIAPELAAIAHKCLAKRSGDRYENGTALAADLARYLSGEPVAAPQAAWSWRRLIRWRRRTTLGAAVLVLLGTVAASAAWNQRRVAAAREGVRGTGRAGLASAASRAAAESARASGDADAAREAIGAGVRTCREELARGDSPGIRLLLGDLELLAGDLDAAIADLSAALDADAGLRGARETRGLARAGKLEVLRRARLAGIGNARLAPGPMLPPTPGELESVFPELKELRLGALEDLQEGVRGPPPVSASRTALAVAVSRRLLGDAKGAEELLLPELQAARPPAALLGEAAVTAFELHNPQAARERAQRAAALWPGDPSAHYVAALILHAAAGADDDPERTVRLREALVHARAAQRLGSPEPGASLLEGSVAFLLKDHEGAEQAFSRALASDQGCVSAWIGRAEARLAAGRLEGSNADYAEALRKLPGQSCLLEPIRQRLQK